MAAMRKRNALERRLREIDREKAQLREQIETVRRWADSPVEAARVWPEPRFRDSSGSEAVPVATGARPRGDVLAGVVEMPAADMPDNELALDFSPGPEGLDVKRVVMPRLQRTDLLRPAIGGASAATRLMEPEHDRFRNYLGTAGLKRVRETRRDQGSQRLRTLFLLMMVLTLGFILFKMIT